jgi:hypothetical protein
MSMNYPIDLCCFEICSLFPAGLPLRHELVAHLYCRVFKLYLM